MLSNIGRPKRNQNSVSFHLPQRKLQTQSENPFNIDINYQKVKKKKNNINSRVSEELDFQQNPFTILKVTLTPLEAKCK